MLTKLPIIVILGVFFGGFIIAMLLAPLESLGWWAGWYGDDLKRAKSSGRTDGQAYLKAIQLIPLDKRQYLVFLDGIAKVGGENYADVKTLLKGLERALPNTIILGDVMPYSVSKIALTEEKPLGRLWRQVYRWKKNGRYPLLAFSINARNLFQVLVAADKRYGPVYNLEEAQLILNSLFEHAYQLESKQPLILIGYSGGGQIALGVAPYLERALRVPIRTISLGGVLSSDQGLESTQQLYHLTGSKDQVHKLAAFMCPGRWPIVFNSYWNQAIRQGKIQTIALGPVRHTGAGSYLDDSTFLKDGRSFLEQTIMTIEAIVNQSPEIKDFTQLID